MPFPYRRFPVQCVIRSFLLLLICLFATSIIPSSASPPDTGQAINASNPNLPGYFIKRTKKAPYVLVLVHGITGDGISSWTSQKGTYWPKLMGADPAFDNFDIYVYEYPTSRFGECLAVSDLATNMQTHLKSDFVFENHEKVVFLAHSMGGLIVRTFLLRYREAADKVPMLFFFATPSAGSGKANIASVLPTCYQVEDLRTLDVNSFLKNQHSDWLSANFRDRIVSHCAVETQTSYGSLTVERGSATLLCTTEPLALPTAHSEIVKPDSTSDLAHKFVKNALSDLPTSTTLTDKQVTREVSRNAEIDRRDRVLLMLRNEYILSHDHLSSALIAGTEWPPQDWMNTRLRELGETWSILPGKNSMEFRFSDGAAGLVDTSPQQAMKQPAAEKPCEQSLVGLKRPPEVFLSTWRSVVNSLRKNRLIHDLQNLFEVWGRIPVGLTGKDLIHEALFTLNCMGDRGELRMEQLGTTGRYWGEKFENQMIVFRNP